MRNRLGSEPRRGVRGMRGAGLGVAILAAGALGGGGCSSSGPGAGSSGAGGGAEASCVSNRTFFEQSVWSGFMSTQCTKCHAPDGLAATKGAKLVLEPASYPGFIDQNLATLTELSKIEYEGKSELLQKPLGKMMHGGGAQLAASSPEYKALTELVDRLGKPDTCKEPANTTLKGVKLLASPDTLRKAAIDLCGRLPTDVETQSVAKGGDAALDGALDALLKEDAFYDRLREIFDDTLLTDRFLVYDGYAVDLLDEADYPGIAPYHDPASYNDPKRALINRALAREPLDLIAYIVKNDRPFTDVLTANYTVVNPFSAIAYSQNLTFQDPTNYNEFQEAHITNGAGIPIPHAGVLSTPAFLNRWTTSPTNRNRGRARRVYQFFLATDILKLAMRPVDATTVTAEENPTLNSDLCTVCHKLIDPVAGGFRGYDDYNYEHFDPATPWHDDMFPPGFDGVNMDPTYYTKGLQWLSGQVVTDPRFVLSAVLTVYKGLTGHDPLPYPDAGADFATRLSAWEAQDQFFRATASDFSAGQLNLKSIVKAVIKSPYYRASEAPKGASAVAMQDIGTGKLLGPEMLTRKIAAITGSRWRIPWEWDKPHDWLIDYYKILYGGIDSDTIVSRLGAPNGMIVSVATRMANEVACHSTAWDFTKAQKDRVLFPLVTIDEVPESAGHPVDGSVADIKKNIQYLHQRLLGETLADGDPELARTFQLYLDTWHELNTAADTDLTWDCQGRTDPSTGVDLTDPSILVTDDKNFTVRSWQAVVSYLLSDFKFLYE